MAMITARLTVSNVSVSCCVAVDNFLPKNTLAISSDSVMIALCVCVYLCGCERDKFTPEMFTHLKGSGWRNIMGVFMLELLNGSKSISHQTSVILVYVKAYF